ncbi:MAG: magnesium transporter [Chloroflexi bacterium]|nr:magnesium transporter [Chloroflexota bacterium]
MTSEIESQEVVTGLENREEVQQLTLQLLEDGNREEATSVFCQLHSRDQGQALLEGNQEQRQLLLSLLSAEQVGNVLEYMDAEEAALISSEIAAPELPEILDETRPDVVADILQRLPEEQSEEVLQAMEEPEEVTTLLQYDEDTAGGVMRPVQPVLQGDLSVGSALDVLRLFTPETESLSSVFVVDSEGRMTGSISVVRLALARSQMQVRDIMDEQPIWVITDRDQEECARIMEQYDIGQLPVLDDAELLVGVIHLDDVVDVLEKEATEDMYKMVGVVGEQVVGPLRGSVRRRLPWLYVNLGTVFLAVLVISLFESTITQMISLALFLPIVAAQGGIGSTQTLTLVVRSMALGEISGRRTLRLVLREMSLGLVHGICLGVILGLIAYGWKRDTTLSLALGLAMLGNMLVAGLAGAGVPLLLRRLRLDPAISSAVVVTTFTDLIGFVLFLGLAAILVEYL